MSGRIRPPPHGHPSNHHSKKAKAHRGFDIPNLLKAVAAFRSKNGMVPMLRPMLPYFLKEVKDFVPKNLSEDQLLRKLRNLRANFRSGGRPGPYCPASDWDLYELEVEAWGPCHAYRVRDKASGSANRRMGGEESESEESDESLDLLSSPGNEDAVSPFRYLKYALEAFWKDRNLNLNALHKAMQHVDPVQAKHLDEQFMEIAKDELKLEFVKNKLSIDVISAAECSHADGR